MPYKSPEEAGKTLSTWESQVASLETFEPKYLTSVDKVQSAEVSAKIRNGHLRPGMAFSFGRNLVVNEYGEVDTTDGKYQIIHRFCLISGLDETDKTLVSRTHVVIAHNGKNFVLVDVSKNGTQLDGEGMEKGVPIVLTPGPHEIALIDKKGFVLDVPETADPSLLEASYIETPTGH